MLAKTDPQDIAAEPPTLGDRTALREQLFRESPLERLERVALGCAWALKPGRAGHLPSYGWLCLKNLVAPARGLPDPELDVSEDGTAGMVGDLSVPSMVEAYRHGLHTSGHFGALTWTSPAERCVLFFEDMHIAKRLRRLMRQDRYVVTFDRDFEHVIKACAGRREGRWHVTWITPRIMRTFAALFDAGHVHSFEVWNEAGVLVGGGYGVSVGRVFFTESQFSLEPNTSKLGFTVLNWHLNAWGYALNDGKQPTPTILGMGFREVPRRDFLRLLTKNASSGGKSGRWSVETGPKEIADWQPAPSLAAAE
jgi:leucyl/phenylalanyl-tRNA--protein transferase